MLLLADEAFESTSSNNKVCKKTIVDFFEV